MEGTAAIEVVGPDSPRYNQVVELSDANTKTLGMLPYAVIREAAADRRVFAYVSAGVVQGYALFSRRVRTGDISLTHLCVGQQHRGGGIARSLVEAIVERHPQRAGIRLSCRTDYDADGMWPELGFTKLGERPGRSRAGLPLAVWWRTIAAPSLFDPLPDDMEQRLTIALDGRLAREIYQENEYLDTRALAADWVAELAEFAVSEGVAAALNEAEHHKPSTREPHGFRILNSDPVQSQELEASLRSNLANDGQEQSSPSMILAMVAQAAVGGASHLLTRDEGLLEQSERIERMVGLTVLQPADLLLQLQSQGGEHDYKTRTIAASGLSISPLSRVLIREDLMAFCYTYSTAASIDLMNRLVLSSGHPVGRLDQLADENGLCVALAASRRENELITVSAIRCAAHQDVYTCTRQLLHHLREVAVREGSTRIVVDDEVNAPVVRALQDEGFRYMNPSWVATVRTAISGPQDPLPEEFHSDRLETLTPEFVSLYEKHMWPSKVFSGIVPSYIVPIQPEYARVLLGYEEPQGRLFEEHQLAAAARENVYYRSPRYLEAPARLLWWVSGGGSYGGMRALSWLDAVDVGDPQQLHSKYRNRGVLDEHEIVLRAQASRKTGIQTATALLFSRTDVFPHAIPLARAQELYRDMQIPGYFQTIKQIDELSVFSFYKEGMTYDD
ncbi:GNAT family N-acetyltransferase [Candidatus Poriferisodalis sp.]|uniref:GNAT family N-acetyltransferase n=1 Tax=Candidatus Poriferisodalis sp. TaxID=3101277 RepID=UPI003B5A6BD1